MDLIKRILNQDIVNKLEAENMFMMGEIMAEMETVKKKNSDILQKLKDSEDSVSLLKAKILTMEEAHRNEVAILRTSYENKISEIRKFRNRACSESFTETQADQKDPFSFTSIYTTPQFDWQSAPSYPVENTSSNSNELTDENEKDKGLWLYIPVYRKNYEFFIH